MAKDPVAAARGAVGGNRLAASRDMNPVAARARAGLRRKFEREADPEGVLDPAERARRTDHLVRAYYAELNLRRLQARAKKQRQGGEWRAPAP